MRNTTIALLLLALVAPLFAGPAETEEAALATRVAGLLRAESRVDRAWGAYLAGKHGIETTVPRLLELLAEHAEDEGYEGQALRRAVLDALIRLGGRPDLSTCRPLVTKHPTPMVVLLSGLGPEAEALLQPLLSVEEGVSPFTLMAARMLLAEWRSPRLAAVLLSNLKVQATVTVMSKNTAIGIGGGSSSTGNPRSKELLPDLPLWPPAVRYVLSDAATPGAVLLAPGMHPIYYRRIEVARESGGGFPLEAPRIDWNAFRIRCLAHLMRWNLRFVGFAHYDDEWVYYESDEQYLQEARGFLDGIREKHANLVKQLLANKLLTEEEAAAIRLDLEFRVMDARPYNEYTELPELK